MMNYYVLSTNIQLPKNSLRPSSFHPYILEPIRPAILLEQELLAVRKPARDTSLAFGGVGAVEVGGVLVAYIAEPEGGLVLKFAVMVALIGMVTEG